MKKKTLSALTVVAIAVVSLAFSGSSASADVAPWCTNVAGSHGRVTTINPDAGGAFVATGNLGRFDSITTKTWDGVANYAFVTTDNDHVVMKQRYKRGSDTAWTVEVFTDPTGGVGSDQPITALEICTGNA